MSEPIPNEFSQINESSLSQSEMTKIYGKLATSESQNFDSKEELKFVEHSIEECFDLKFRQILTKTLQENEELINNTFVKLLKFCVDKNFKKFGFIFIGYCDYFDLDYNKTFLVFHEKLKKLIKHSCQCMIGKDCYDKYVQKTNGNSLQIKSLFDLYQK